MAKLQEEGSLASATFCGTPLYMAPETWQQQASVHSDQYSLAVTYAEMRQGRHLFPGKDLYQICKQHTEGTPDLAPLGEAEQRVLFKALAKDPHQRYPSCTAFVRALEEAFHPPAPPRPAPPSRLRRLIPWVLLALLVPLGLAGAYRYLFAHTPRIMLHAPPLLLADVK